MSVYEEMVKWDVIEPIEDKLFSGEFHLKLDEDGKERITIPHIVDQNPKSPWIFAGVDTERICLTWFQIYFNTYGIISRNCFNCWKTVCRPQTIDQLFAMEKLQDKLLDEHGFKGKCGLEKRPYGSYKGLYAAFWYNPEGSGGLVEARKRTKIIEEAVHEEIGPLPVILKRACTEMEERAGRSNDWVYPKEQDKFEDKLDELFDVYSAGILQTPLIKNHIRRSWLEWGFERGDEEVAKYVDSFPEGFGTTKTVDYFHSNPVICSGQVRRGKLGKST